MPNPYTGGSPPPGVYVHDEIRKRGVQTWTPMNVPRRISSKTRDGVLHLRLHYCHWPPAQTYHQFVHGPVRVLLKPAYHVGSIWVFSRPSGYREDPLLPVWKALDELERLHTREGPRENCLAVKIAVQLWAES
jgi:hypothetical protein